MTRIKVGDKLVCINREGWSYMENKEPTDLGPKYKEVVTFDGIYGIIEGTAYIFIREYNFICKTSRVNYAANLFVPLSGADAKAHLIMGFDLVRESSDYKLPITNFK